MYAVKFQLIYNPFNKTIFDVFPSEGKVHDFQIFKNSNIQFLKESTVIADLGYQGLQHIHENTLLPIKRSKNKKLTIEQKQYNNVISKSRVIVEHVFAWLKRFKILVNRCRKSKFRLMYLWFNLICELFNKLKPLKNVN